MNKKAIMYLITTVLAVAVASFSGSLCYADGEGNGNGNNGNGNGEGGKGRGEIAMFIGEMWEGVGGTLIHAYPTNAASNAVDGVYDKSMSRMRLTIPDDASIVSVQLDNMSTGSTGSYQAEVCSGTSELWVPAQAGCYMIQLLLPDGRYYVGTFMVE